MFRKGLAWGGRRSGNNPGLGRIAGFAAAVLALGLHLGGLAPASGYAEGGLRLSAAPDWQAPSPEPSVSLVDVRLERKAERLRLHVVLSQKTPLSAFALIEPERLVVDVPGARLKGGPRTIAIDDPIVRQIRLGQFAPDTARIVLDLASPVLWVLGPESPIASGGTTSEEGKVDLSVDIVPALTELALAPLGTGVVLALQGTGPMRPKVASALNPPRLIIDFDGLDLPPIPGLIAASPGQAGAGAPVPDKAGSEPSYDKDRLLLPGTGATVAAGSPRPGQGLWSSPLPRSMPAESVLGEIGLSQPFKTTGPVKSLKLTRSSPGAVRVTLELETPVIYRLQYDDEGKKVSVILGLEPSGRRLIAVDPGHGGSQPGAVGPRGTLEKDVNLQIALRFADLLERAGFDVFLTRRTDQTVEVSERALDANSRKADVFISIHANAFAGGQVSGTEVYHMPGAGASRFLAEAVLRELVSVLGLPSRGIKARGDLAVLRRAEMPAILAEVAFLTHPDEERLLLDPAFQDLAAQGLFNGLMSYLVFLGDRPQRSLQTFEEDLFRILRRLPLGVRLQ